MVLISEFLEFLEKPSAHHLSGALTSHHAGIIGSHHSSHHSDVVDHTTDTDDVDQDKPCRLIAGVFAIVIQLLLGIVVLSALFLKRYWNMYKCRLKKPERDFKTWVLDISKQAVGSCFAHGCNVVLAMLLSTISIQNPGEHPMHPDECAWYFINFLVDSFLGIPLIWALLEVLHMVAQKCNLEALTESGNYGNDNVYCTWLTQLIAWLWIVFATKLTLGLLIWPLGRTLGRFGVWMFGPLHRTPEIELVLVMVLAPCIINVFVFWIYDNMLMAGPPASRNDKDADVEEGPKCISADTGKGHWVRKTEGSVNQVRRSTKDAVDMPD